MNIRKNDTVVVISGAYKGTIGKVLKALPKQKKLIVEKVNTVKKHTKPSQQNQQGGIIELQQPISADKVMLYDEKNKQVTKAVYQKDNMGRRLRICKKTGNELNSKR